MYKVHAKLSRADAERLSDILAGDLSPCSAVSIEEMTRTLWSLDAFATEESLARDAAAIIEKEIPGSSASVQKLEDRDWVAASLAGLPAVHAGPFIVAGAHELARETGGRIPVWIEASTAFGTGHHGTTKGCLEALAKILRQRKIRTVLDIGTGSGVLAIAALKGGAETALATDLDAESVRIAHENARNNHMGPRLKLLHAAGANHAAIRNSAPYDLVMANILARPLVSLSKDLSRLVKPVGFVVLSGLLKHQEPQVKAAYSGCGLVLVSRKIIHGWSTLVYTRPQ